MVTHFQFPQHLEIKHLRFFWYQVTKIKSKQSPQNNKINLSTNQQSQQQQQKTNPSSNLSDQKRKLQAGTRRHTLFFSSTCFALCWVNARLSSQAREMIASSPGSYSHSFSFNERRVYPLNNIPPSLRLGYCRFKWVLGPLVIQSWMGDETHWLNLCPSLHLREGVCTKLQWWKWGRMLFSMNVVKWCLINEQNCPSEQASWGTYCRS